MVPHQGSSCVKLVLKKEPVSGQRNCLIENEGSVQVNEMTPA